MLRVIGIDDNIDIPDGTKIVEWHKNKSIRKGQISDSVIELRLYGNYNRKIKPNTLPDTLERIIFSLEFTRKIIPGSLPSNLRYIEFGAGYYRTLLPGSLPESVEHVIFNNGCNKKLDVSVLPDNLSILEIYREDMRITPGALSDEIDDNNDIYPLAPIIAYAD